MDEIQTLKQWVAESNNIVFFGGAGVSTESGIPDFRSVDGLYHQKYDYPPETILSHTFFMRKTSEFYKFYKDKLLLEGAKPNAAHLKLAELEKAGKLKAVITQNIDGLHQLAGSEEVLELHGSVQRNYCMKCHEFYDFAAIKEKVEEASKTNEPGCPDYMVPKCEKCGATIKPDVVLYEEGLDNSVLTKAVRYIANADVLIIGGTSLVVYPAAGLIDYYSGNKLVLVNLSATAQDSRADLVVRGKIGEVFSQL
ncbi:MAG: NAD-dependent protein deacylase [Lachnospiraceae bacterium]|nr:NAD-dependent protein deacylase [Lachnospiraceae bacterium]